MGLGLKQSLIHLLNILTLPASRSLSEYYKPDPGLCLSSFFITHYINKRSVSTISLLKASLQHLFHFLFEYVCIVY
jgi:hypothetical protein